jgi:hypothetical protein
MLHCPDVWTVRDLVVFVAQLRYGLTVEPALLSTRGRSAGTRERKPIRRLEGHREHPMGAGVVHA